MNIIDLKIEANIPNWWDKSFDYNEDLEKIKAIGDKIGLDHEFLILIGNGGSITSSIACGICQKIDSFVVDSPDPAFLRKIKSQCLKEKTLVLAISKSGNTVGVIESLLYFADYKTVVVTDNQESLLEQMAEKNNWQIIDHPKIEGRFSGNTIVQYLKSYLCGVDINKIKIGFKTGYKNRDPAYSLAKFYFDKEKKGYNEVYISCYPWLLNGFRNLIIQLMHESVCKDGKGQTFYFSEAPECQHHTNQRFLGGKKNVIGTFIKANKFFDDRKIEAPENLKDISARGLKLDDLAKLTYQQALNLEYTGTKMEADRLEIPNVTIEIEEVTNYSVGELIAFWQLVAFYSAKLRNVDPSNQPAVENSKKIIIDEIKNLN